MYLSIYTQRVRDTVSVWSTLYIQKEVPIFKNKIIIIALFNYIIITSFYELF